MVLDANSLNCVKDNYGAYHGEYHTTGRLVARRILRCSACRVQIRWARESRSGKTRDPARCDRCD